MSVKKENSPFKKRLVEFLKYLGEGQTAFEARVGLANGSINKIVKSMKQGNIDKIAEANPELNINWLVRGEGEMLAVRDNLSNEASMSYNLNTDCEREVEALKRENEFLKAQLESEKEKNALKDEMIKLLKSSDESSKRKVKKNADNFS